MMRRGDRFAGAGDYDPSLKINEKARMKAIALKANEK